MDQIMFKTFEIGRKKKEKESRRGLEEIEESRRLAKQTRLQQSGEYEQLNLRRAGLMRNKIKKAEFIQTAGLGRVLCCDTSNIQHSVLRSIRSVYLRLCVKENYRAFSNASSKMWTYRIALHTLLCHTWGSPTGPRLATLLNDSVFFVRENIWNFLYATVANLDSWVLLSEMRGRS